MQRHGDVGELRCRVCNLTPEECGDPVSREAVAFTCSRCLILGRRVPGNPSPRQEQGVGVGRLRKHAEVLSSAGGFSGTSKRGGRPRLPESERRAHERDRKRRQRVKP